MKPFSSSFNLPPGPGTVASALGPIALPKDHKVLFGRVEGQNRGENAMSPTLERNDDLFWLRDDERADPTVMAHLRVENEFTQQKTAHLEAFREQLYQEHLAHLKESDTTAKVKHGPYYYYTRTVKGLSYRIYARQPVAAATMGAIVTATPTGTGDDATTPPEPGEEVMLDVNILAQGQKHCDVSSVEPSPGGHEWIAFGVDFKGDEVYELRVGKPNLKGTIDVVDSLSGTDGSVEWGNSADYLFYVTKDEVKRSDKVWFHRMNTPQSTDILIAHESDELFSIGCGKSKHGQHLIVQMGSSETTEMHAIDLQQLGDVLKRATAAATNEASLLTSDVRKLLKRIRPRQKGHRYGIDIHGSSQTVFIMTNMQQCFNNKILVTTVDELLRVAAGAFGAVDEPSSNAVEPKTAAVDPWDAFDVLVPHSASRKIDGVDAFENFASLSGREDGLTQAWFMTLQTHQPASGVRLTFGPLVTLTWPEPIYSVDVTATPDFDSPTFRVFYSSLTTPATSIDVNPLTGERQTVKRKEVLGGYNPDDYVAERHYATSPDGVKISMSLVRRRDLNPKASHPTLLYGYGSYGICIDPDFMQTALIYLKRGIVFGIAHIRGGGENGRLWYEQHGKYLTKRNTFADFTACAEHLVEQGMTTPATLAIEGRSAGGLLIGAVLNLRPDLFRCAIAGVPFVDVMVTMADSTIPLTTGEWEEWGNPNENRFYSYMLSYSPMDNIHIGRPYPSVLIVAGLHDPRVAYWEPAKWATRLRLAQLPLVEPAGSSSSLAGDVLLKMDLEVGHFSASDRYKYLREKSFEQAFVIWKITSSLK